ncbi:MAG: hypothetical protein K0B07_04250 [DPANN group archaeon]|nr:hypothetical protein [DPANN group archaeon]
MENKKFILLTDPIDKNDNRKPVIDYIQKCLEKQGYEVINKVMYVNSEELEKYNKTLQTWNNKYLEWDNKTFNDSFEYLDKIDKKILLKYSTDNVEFHDSIVTLGDYSKKDNTPKKAYKTLLWNNYVKNSQSPEALHFMVEKKLWKEEKEQNPECNILMVLLNHHTVSPRLHPS